MLYARRISLPYLSDEKETTIGPCQISSEVGDNVNC